MVDEYLMKSTFCQQLRATLIRNLKLKIRDSRKTTAEVFLPFYTLGTLIVLKIFIPNPNFPAILHPSGDVRLFEHFSNLKNQTIAVLPHWNSSKWQTSAFLETVNDLWLKMRPGRDISPIKWMMYETQEDLLSAYWRDPYSMPLALVFHSEDPLNGPLRYEIRTNPSYFVMPSTTELYSSPVTCRQSDNYFSAMIPIETGDSCPVNQYYYSGFIALQYLLDYAKLIISSQNEYLQVPNITLEIFPKEAHTGNWMVAFRLVIPIYMVMALSQFITYLLILVVGEKETHIREGLKIMGLRDSVYWVAWFIIYAVFVTFLTIVSVILLFSLSVFQHTNYLPVFILVLLYSLSVILIGFMITPFFDNSRTAGILGNFVVNIMSLLYFIQVFIDNTDTSITLWIISIISPTGFALAMDKILVLDISGQGVTLNNLFHISGEGIPLGGSVLMLLFDVILYAMLAFYLDAVIPGDHGTKQSPCFCLSKNYWFEKKIPKTSLLNGESASSSNNADEQLRNVEPVSREMRGKEAIKIVDLYKTFQSCRKPEVNAVNGINLTIYQGQITAILGHNGAGKSTLFNILTGMCSPTNGTAYIFGYDVRDPNDMAMIRRMTGVCPQHDILFDQLTAKEHLYFFAAIRGIPKSMVEYEVKKTLIDCDLYETAADTHSKNLSGGQKRKLSVGIAIIGDPKIIILDEPTAGVDPYSRRHMWSLLQKRKSGKVILLTTHFMDEADILADRKAVISKGRLRCCGSSLFLKNKFGVGYHLTLVLETNAREATITKLVKQHVTQAKRARHHGRELSYILPHDSVDFFAGLFMDIEFEISTKKHHLGIISYGVSMTTLEEVFLQLETDNEQDNDNMSNSENYRKRMIKNPALRRSISLQGRTSSYHSLQNENCRSTTLNNCDISSNKGTIRSLPDKCSTFNFSNTACDDSDNLNNNSSINNNHLINTSRSSLFENDSNESPVESKGKTSLIQSNNHLQAKSSWLDVNSIQLVPSNWHTTAALLKLRLLILIRDLQKLYLMIILPLGFAALGLYLNSIQVIIPVMRSIVLDNNTYGQDARIAVYDSTTNEQSDGYNKFINELNKLVDVDEEVDGNYSSLLNISPHMAALNVNVLSSSQISITVLYNDTTQHSLPVILNILSNTLYRLFVDTSDYQNIEVRSHPFQQTSQPQGFNIGTLTSALFIGMIFILIPVSLAVDMVYDREMKAKNQLRVNGLSIYMYFLSYCIVLTGLMVIICAALLGLIYIFDVPSFRQPPALITLGILVTLYSPAAILCSTCFSYFFDRTDSAQSILPNILTFVGLIPFCLVALLDMLEIEVQAAKALHYTFSLCFPPYISYALVYFVDRVYVACTVNSACADLTFANYMTNDIIIMIVGVLLHIPIWLLCLRIVDVKKSGGKLSDIFQGFSTIKENDSVIHEECYGEYEDEDVRNERSKVYRICNGQCPADPPVLIVKNLRKEYKQDESFCNVSCSPEEESASNLKVAVRCLSFTADSGEILGLLGHNGAGKTTTMRMITGEMLQTMGSIRIGGHDHTTDKENAFKNLGYCPQHDALWKNVTIREHLELYATIRGVPKKDIPRLINTYLHGLQINEHANKQTQHCSGGTRRKLSYAMAIIGTPKVVLLDEPSTGMDPKSKRLLWDTILSNDLNIRGAIILTTHSMEEADALCSRVGIMVKGEMRCLGSTQHLKNLYGAGYTLEIKLKHFEENYNSTSLENVSMQTSSQPILFNRESQMHSMQEDRVNSLKNFIIELFPDACLEESFADRLVYSVPQHAVNSLAQCFSNLEKAKTELNIEEYSFSQTTLEQVFLKFAHFDEENATIL